MLLCTANCRRRIRPGTLLPRPHRALILPAGQRCTTSPQLGPTGRKRRRKARRWYPAAGRGADSIHANGVPCPRTACSAVAREPRRGLAEIGPERPTAANVRRPPCQTDAVARRNGQRIAPQQSNHPAIRRGQRHSPWYHPEHLYAAREHPQLSALPRRGAKLL
ncbi:hypothetical protein BDV95DRAFT_252158 [Massariosphaeria phaeospora]|uniref:Uncharacterized protein n=1 Tax=Massariosphaeria phaeospora TaxID=100035 RepID=A0A7C8M248_9PLEO|nr:hypothetical protein BDV95DRAFT_252158 [Massariosphaeria phaeospora]